MRKINTLCYLTVLLTLIAAAVGIFYTTGNDSFTVINIYGDRVELYGDGIYKDNSVLMAGGNKGTDLVMLFSAAAFAFFTVKKAKKVKYQFLQVGVLSGILYYSACLVFGVTFNRLFPVYVLLFSASLFSMIFLLRELLIGKNVPDHLAGKSFKGTAYFLIISGSSVLVWLEFIIPSIITGQPLPTIEVYTTVPTFVLDLALILPFYWGCGIALLKKKEIGYKLAPVLLTFITIIGFTVIGQNIFQSSMGIEIPPQQLFSLVISFVVLGAISIILNRRFFKQLAA